MAPTPDAQERNGLVRPPLCFVVMPFGVKPDSEGGSIDFDAVYSELIAPAIRKAELEPLRGDEELVGGFVHRPMFERLILADYAVADLTTANANVFYELGVRHAFRPHSTVLVSAQVGRAPFDIAPGRMLPYGLDGSGRPADTESSSASLAKALVSAREKKTDSPLFQLIQNLPQPQLAHLRTDVFRQAEYSLEVKESLAVARGQSSGAVRAVEEDLGILDDVEAGVIVDLLLSYRATKAWAQMIRLVETMPTMLSRTVLVREQYGFALNRAGRSAEAERVLLAVLRDHGPSSETFGLLGRVYKDRWEKERNGSVLRAEGLLEEAIDAYRRGFEADWRDDYPGINAITLMEIREPGANQQQELLPVVRYANQRRLARGGGDYWDHATQLELGVIARDKEEAWAAARSALAAIRERWEPESTAYNLSLIRESREHRGTTLDWASQLEDELRRAAG